MTKKAELLRISKIAKPRPTLLNDNKNQRRLKTCHLLPPLSDHMKSTAWGNNAMTYRNEILATVSVRLPLVSLLPLGPPLFQVNPQCAQIRSQRSGAPFRCVLRPELPGMERPFAGILGRGCKAEASARGGGGGCGRDGGGRGEALGTKARKKEREREREESSKALQRRGGNTAGEEADSSSLSRSRTHSRTRAASSYKNTERHLQVKRGRRRVGVVSDI
ncbi:hypothetical protein ABVT39_000869 [Epinephelus coioides]